MPYPNSPSIEAEQTIRRACSRRRRDCGRRACAAIGRPDRADIRPDAGHPKPRRWHRPRRCPWSGRCSRRDGTSLDPWYSGCDHGPLAEAHPDYRRECSWSGSSAPFGARQPPHRATSKPACLARVAWSERPCAATRCAHVPHRPGHQSVGEVTAPPLPPFLKPRRYEPYRVFSAEMKEFRTGIYSFVHAKSVTRRTDASNVRRSTPRRQRTRQVPAAVAVRQETRAQGGRCSSTDQLATPARTLRPPGGLHPCRPERGCADASR